MKTQRRRAKLGSRASKIRQSSIGLYSLMLLAALAVTTIGHTLATAALPFLDADVLSQPVNGLFAILYAWILAGLTICALLFAWLRLKAVGLALSALLAIVWLLGLRRHLGSASILLYVLPLAGGSLLFWVGVRFASGHVLPIHDQAQARRAFVFLQRHLWTAGRPGYFLSGTSKGNMPALVGESGPLFVFTGCDHAVAVSDKLRLKGVRGPGLVFIRPDERIAQVLDLRPQVRSFSLEGRTQDGIQVRVRASVAFQIDAGRRKAKLGEPLPFSSAAAFRAIQAQRVEHTIDERLLHGVTHRLWDDLPSIKGEHLLRDIVSRLDFDDLYGPHQLDGEFPRQKVDRILQTRLQAVLAPIGIQLLTVDLGNFEPADPQVYVKRARNWQTEWIRKVTLAQAEGQVERLQILERARADARTELILDLGRQLKNLAASKADVGPDTVLHQFFVVLETLMTRPQLQDALPEHTKDVLSDLRETIGD